MDAIVSAIFEAAWAAVRDCGRREDQRGEDCGAVVDGGEDSGGLAGGDAANCEVAPGPASAMGEAEVPEGGFGRSLHGDSGHFVDRGASRHLPGSAAAWSSLQHCGCTGAL